MGLAAFMPTCLPLCPSTPMADMGVEGLRPPARGGAVLCPSIFSCLGTGGTQCVCRRPSLLLFEFSGVCALHVPEWACVVRACQQVLRKRWCCHTRHFPCMWLQFWLIGLHFGIMSVRQRHSKASGMRHTFATCRNSRAQTASKGENTLTALDRFTLGELRSANFARWNRKLRDVTLGYPLNEKKKIYIFLDWNI